MIESLAIASLAIESLAIASREIESLDRDHVLAGDLGHRQQAGVDRFVDDRSVEPPAQQHCASSAIAFPTTDLRAAQPRRSAQIVDERQTGTVCNVDETVVQQEAHGEKSAAGSATAVDHVGDGPSERSSAHSRMLR